MGANSSAKNVDSNHRVGVAVGATGVFDRLLGRAEANKSTCLTNGPSPPACDAHLKRALEHAVVRDGMKISVFFDMPVRPPLQVKTKRCRTTTVVNGAFAKVSNRRGLRKGLRSEDDIAFPVIKDLTCRILEEDALQIDRKVPKDAVAEKADSRVHLVSSYLVEEVVLADKNERSPKATRVSKSVCSPVKRLSDKDTGKKGQGNDEVEDMDIVPCKVGGSGGFKPPATNTVRPCAPGRKSPRGHDQLMGESDLKETSWLSDDHALLKNNSDGKEKETDRQEHRVDTRRDLNPSNPEPQRTKSRRNEPRNQTPPTEPAITLTDATPSIPSANPSECHPQHDVVTKTKISTARLAQKRKLQPSLSTRSASPIQPVRKAPRVSNFTPSASPFHKVISACNRFDPDRVRPALAANRPQTRSLHAPRPFQKVSVLLSTKHPPTFIKDNALSSRDVSHTDEQAFTQGASFRSAAGKARSTSNTVNIATAVQKQAVTTKTAEQKGPYLRKQDPTLNPKPKFINKYPQLSNGPCKVYTAVRQKDLSSFSNISRSTSKDCLVRVNSVKNAAVSSKKLNIIHTRPMLSSPPPISSPENRRASAPQSVAIAQKTNNFVKVSPPNIVRKKVSSDPIKTTGIKRSISAYDAVAPNSEENPSKKVRIQVSGGERLVKDKVVTYSDRTTAVLSRKVHTVVNKRVGNGLTPNQKINRMMDASKAVNGKRTRSAVTLSQGRGSVIEPTKRSLERDNASTTRAILARRKSFPQLSEDAQYQQTLGKLDPLMKKPSPSSGSNSGAGKLRGAVIPNSSPPKRGRYSSKTASEAEKPGALRRKESNSCRKPTLVKGNPGLAKFSPKVHEGVTRAVVQSIPSNRSVEKSVEKAIIVRTRSQRSPRKTKVKSMANGTSKRSDDFPQEKSRDEATTKSREQASDSLAPHFRRRTNQKSKSLQAKGVDDGLEVTTRRTERQLDRSGRFSQGEGRKAVSTLDGNNKSLQPSEALESGSGSCGVQALLSLIDLKDFSEGEQLITHFFDAGEHSEDTHNDFKGQSTGRRESSRNVERPKAKRLPPRRKLSLTKRDKSENGKVVTRRTDEVEGDHLLQHDLEHIRIASCGRSNLNQSGDDNGRGGDEVVRGRRLAAKHSIISNDKVKCSLRTRKYTSKVGDRDKGNGRR